MESIKQNGYLTQTAPIAPLYCHHCEAHSLDLRPSTTGIITQIFFVTIWITYLPVATIAKSLLLFIEIFDNTPSDIAAFKEELLNFVSGSGPKSTHELELLIAKYKTKPNFPMKEITPLIQILSIVEFRPFIREILAGANIRVQTDQTLATATDVLNLWPMFNGMASRPSSHKAHPDCTWGVETKAHAYEHILVWVGKDQRTIHIQFEKTSFTLGPSPTTLLKALVHGLDLIKYLATGKQLGPAGESTFTDAIPITCRHSDLDCDRIRTEHHRLMGVQTV